MAIGIILIIVCIALLVFFDRPEMYKKMRDRQRSGRQTFEEMAREEFGETYSRLVIIPGGLGTFYLFINIMTIILVVAGIYLVLSFKPVDQEARALGQPFF